MRELIERCMADPPAGAGARAGPRSHCAIRAARATSPTARGIKRGVGFAVGYKNVAFSEGFDDSATARVTLTRTPDGPEAEIHTAAVEMGQGLYTFLTQVVRTELEIDRVVMHPIDTLIGGAGSTSASRQSMMAGGAVQMACAAVRETLFDRARARPGRVRATRHRARRSPTAGSSAGGSPLVELDDLLDEPVSCEAVYHHRPTEGFDENGQGDVHVCFAFAAERAVVEVDEDLGLVRVLQVAAAIDAGRVLNPIGLTGQIEGGTAQGLGLGLMEEVQLADGVIRNPSFTDYLIPTILDMPPVVSVAVEEPEPGVPYGLKGIGESPTIVATAAVVAALRDATGRELNRAPVTPDELVGLRGPAATAGPPPSPDVPGQKSVPFYFEMSSGQQKLM